MYNVLEAVGTILLSFGIMAWGTMWAFNALGMEVDAESTVQGATALVLIFTGGKFLLDVGND